MVICSVICSGNNQWNNPEILHFTVLFEPTDRRKAIKPLHGGQQLAYSTPNISELRAMAQFIKPNCVVDTSSYLNEIIDLAKIMTQYINLLIVTLGSKGVVTAQRVKEHERNYLLVNFYPVTTLTEVENVSGAGDCFTSGFVFGKLQNYKDPDCISIGFEAARHSLLCKQTVPLQFHFSPYIKKVFFETSKCDIN